MRSGLMRYVLAVIVFVVATPLFADDLTGSNEILCTAVLANVCTSEGECLSGPPWNWDIPQFIEIDLSKKTLSTTKASGENRSTPIKNVERDNGLIFLQGVEGGRAFSFVISETDGMVSVAVARDGFAVAVFGACTPR